MSHERSTTSNSGLDVSVLRGSNHDATDTILRIRFAPPGELARRVISRSNMKPTGRFPSYRMRRQLCWDSPAELNFLRLVDTVPTVLELREQPCTIYYRIGGVERKHIPDFFVRGFDGRTLWEVKTADDAAKPEIASRTALLAAGCPRLGYDYKVAIAEDLRSQPRLRNAQLVRRNGCAEITFEQRVMCSRLFQTCDSFSWASIVGELHGPLTLHVACRLVLEGVLTIDLSSELMGQSARVVSSSVGHEGGDHE